MLGDYPQLGVYTKHRDAKHVLEIFVCDACELRQRLPIKYGV
jgi:hypothetical protein